MTDINDKFEGSAPKRGRGRPPGTNPGGRPPATAGIQGRVRDRALAQAEIKPLQVMLEAMGEAYKAAQELPKGDDRLKAMQAAAAAADRVAPYLHPRLQATTVKGDAENPLSVILDLPDTNALRAAIRGQDKDKA